MDIALLWKQRRTAYWNEILPYFKYVASSGFLGLLFLIFIAFSYYYAKLIVHLPEQFPIIWVDLLLLLPALFVSPIRTFIKQADIIFLLPVEKKMKEYFRYSFFYSFFTQLFFLLISLIIAWPLYMKSTTHNASFVAYLIVLIGFKMMNMVGSWQEKKMVHPLTRRIYSWFRVLLSGFLLYVLLRFQLVNSIILIVLVWLTYYFILRLASRFSVNWNHLISLEEQHRFRMHMFLNWFVDMPELRTRFSQRVWISRIGERLSFTSNNTWKYLYWKLFTRSETLSIVLRLIIVGVLMEIITIQDIGKAIIYIIFSYLIHLHLLSLTQYYPSMLWLNVYPLKAALRIDSIISIAMRVQLFVLILLYIPVLFTQQSIVLFALPILTFVISYGMTRVRRRKAGNNE